MLSGVAWAGAADAITAVNSRGDSRATAALTAALSALPVTPEASEGALGLSETGGAGS